MPKYHQNELCGEGAQFEQAWVLEHNVLSDAHARNYHDSLDAAKSSYLNKVMGNDLQYDDLGQPASSFVVVA